MNQEIPNMDAMANAFMHTADDEQIIVKAEELPLEGGGMDYSKIFFEPQINKSYTLKFITNPFGEKLTHRKVYKNLPDPKRRGKTFHVVSSGSAKTCKTLEAFFELYNLKKEGDVLAIQKLKEFMGVTNQACAIVQVLSSPDAAEIGIYRLFTLSTFGPNPTIANLIDTKLNPTKEMLADGFEKEDIFNIFGSTALSLKCEEADFEGRKGRDYGKSLWTPTKKGAFVKWTTEEGEEKTHTFSETDINAGVMTDEAKLAFGELIKILSVPELSIHNYFSYKQIGDPKNTEETDKYLKDVQEKVDEIIPVILKAGSIAEIKNYGIADTSSPKTTDSATMIGGAKAADILKDSVPNELVGSIMQPDADSGEKQEEKVTNENVSSNPDVANILGS